MSTYKKQLKDKDGNTIYPDVGIDLDNVIYGDDPTPISNYIDPASYSTTEANTGGTWIDGKPIYKKTVYFSSLPNATTNTVSLGATNVDYVIKMEGSAYRASDQATFPIPNPSAIAVANAIDLAYLRASNEVQIRTGLDRSNCNGYVTVYYTKTTD